MNAEDKRTTATASPRAGNRLANLLKALVTLALLGVVAATVDLRRVGQSLLGVCWGDLALATLLYQLGILVRAYRWQALLRGQGAEISLSRLVNLYYVGTFFNSFLPSGFGGDVVRALEVLQDGAKGTVAVSTVLIDRLMGLEMLLLMALGVLPFYWRWLPGSTVISLLALLIGTTSVLCALLGQRQVMNLMRRLRWVHNVLAQKIGSSFAWTHYGREALLKAAIASLVFNLLLILAQTLLGRAVGVRISLGYFFVFVPIISALLALPISISGFGVREGGYVFLFGQVGVGTAEAAAMSLLFYGLNVITGLVGAGLYLGQALTLRRSNRNL